MNRRLIYPVGAKVVYHGYTFVVEKWLNESGTVVRLGNSDSFADMVPVHLIERLLYVGKNVEGEKSDG